jgi:Base plate wedge protein 53
MNYFSKFPLFVYDNTIVRDILRRTYFVSDYKNYVDLYTPYMILDGDTPESIAQKEYGSVGLWWVVLVFNEIHDMYSEWPKDEPLLIEFCKSKYPGETLGVANMDRVFYYMKDDIIVSEMNPPVDWNTWQSPPEVIGASPITFYDHESSENEKLRRIRLLRPELVQEFVRQFEQVIKK